MIIRRINEGTLGRGGIGGGGMLGRGQGRVSTEGKSSYGKGRGMSRIWHGMGWCDGSITIERMSKPVEDVTRI